MINFFFIGILKTGLIPLMVCFNFSFLLFIFGLVGIVWNKKSFLIMLVCIELTLFAVSLNFIFIALYTHIIWGQVISLLVITSAAAETAIGLSLLVISYRLGDKINYTSLVNLRG